MHLGSDTERVDDDRAAQVAHRLGPCRAYGDLASYRAVVALALIDVTLVPAGVVETRLDEVFWVFNWEASTPNYDKILEVGLREILQEVTERKASLEEVFLTLMNEESRSVEAA